MQLKKTKEGFFFDDSDNQIKELIGTGNESIYAMIYRPLHVFPSQFKVVNIVILNFLKPNESTKYCSVDLAEDNKQVMSFLSKKIQ